MIATVFLTATHKLGLSAACSRCVSLRMAIFASTKSRKSAAARLNNQGKKKATHGSLYEKW